MFVYSLVTKFGWMKEMVRMVKCLTQFSRRHQADEIEAFFAQPQNSRLHTRFGVEQAVEKIRANADWLQRDAPTMESSLSAMKN